jgi:hypothetical protein
MCENGTLKLVKVISRREGKKENNGGDEPKWYTLSVYLEMS